MSDFFNSNEEENTSATLLTDDCFDEMQKAENYKIGFKLFKIIFYAVLFFSGIMYIVSCNGGQTPLAVMSFILHIFAWVIYIIYAAETSAKGVMNPAFARNASKDWQIPVYIAFSVLVTLLTVCGVYNFAQTIIWITIMTANIFISHYAKRNMKVLEKQLKDGDEE